MPVHGIMSLLQGEEMRKLWFYLQTADSNEQVDNLKSERSSQIMTHSPLQAQELMR